MYFLHLRTLSTSRDTQFFRFCRSFVFSTEYSSSPEESVAPMILSRSSPLPNPLDLSPSPRFFLSAVDEAAVGVSRLESVVLPFAANFCQTLS